MKSEKIKLYYSIFLSVMTAIVGITFIVQAADIYYSGLAPDHVGDIYTVETIKAHLTLPLIFLFIWIAAIIGGFVLSVVFPIKSKVKALPNEHKTLSRLKAIMPINYDKEISEINKKIKTYDLIRLVAFCVSLVFCLSVAIFLLTYTLNPENYHSNNLSGDIMALVKNVLIWVGIGFVIVLFSVFLEVFAVKSEITCIKKAIALKGKGDGIEDKTPQKRTFCTYIVVAVVSLVFIIISAIIKTSVEVLILYAAITALFELICFCAELYGKGKLPLFGKAEKGKSQINLIISRALVGTVAVVFIIIGIVNGGAEDVLVKAIKICTECIGLG